MPAVPHNLPDQAGEEDRLWGVLRIDPTARRAQIGHGTIDGKQGRNTHQAGGEGGLFTGLPGRIRAGGDLL